ncbi:MAG: hypothetical protein J6T22_09225 [Bacteroidales bacterium]|nr:hypothetical protein [Bacteroidales bacterium]MBO7617374.1 hypothetical protein [Bacteroidales bacterium]
MELNVNEIGGKYLTVENEAARLSLPVYNPLTGKGYVKVGTKVFQQSDEKTYKYTAGGWQLDETDLSDYYTKAQSDVRFIKSGQRDYDLPEGYEQIRGIVSHGAEYIDTGYLPNPSTFGFDIDFTVWNSIVTSQAPHIFGAGTRADGNDQRIALSVYKATEYGEFRTGAALNINPRITTGVRNRLRLINKVLTYINGDIYNITTTLTDTDCTTNLFLFALQDSGSMARFATCVLRGFKIYEGSVIVREYVPARRVSDGELGLYETHTNTFFTNGGTGAFTEDDTDMTCIPVTGDDVTIGGTTYAAGTSIDVVLKALADAVNE